MRRFLMIVLVLAAACGGAVSDTSDTSVGSAGNESTTSQAEGTTTSEGTEGSSANETPDTTRAPSDTDSPTSDLPLAPDFTLELGTGGEYTLSSTDNPVYLVFWAEW